MQIQADRTDIPSQKRLNTVVYCKDCYEKQQKIDQLKVEVERLRNRLNDRKRAQLALVDSPHTPSSKIILKPNVKKEKLRPGAKKGHKGHGRKPAEKETADRYCRIDMPTVCPDCRGDLKQVSAKRRRIIDLAHERLQTIYYDIARAHCNSCRKTYRNPIPALEKGLLGNNLLANATVLHYFDNLTIGKLADLYDKEINQSTFISNFHRLSRIFEPALTHLIETYRQTKVKHADETGWRTMGRNGYAWIFCSKYTSIFDFADNRSGRIVRKIMGETPLPGVLVVDRYAAYNQAGCPLQYCYAHLLREVEGLKKDYPYNSEVNSFVEQFATALSEAMRLKNMPIDDICYYENAHALKQRIESLAFSSAKNEGIIRIQKIFQEKSERLYHWVDDREVPSHNNFAERMIRSTVIARKVSHGSFSEKGRITRSLLMSILTTAHSRLGHSRYKLITWFKGVLDYISATKQYSNDLLPPIPDK